uniref:hypothetical protein n=1 Tax=Ningiella ruwaisensis TaxID=2364274 RepID=UPI0010A08B3C|nr:hypothetical protein [Ningiella ruwaisensis]
MDKLSQNLAPSLLPGIAKYALGVAVLLVIAGIYLFILAGQTSAVNSDSNTESKELIQDNRDLASRLSETERQNNILKEQVTELSASISEKQSSIEQLQAKIREKEMEMNQANASVSCPELENDNQGLPAEVSRLQSALNLAQSDAQACNASTNQFQASIDALEIEKQALEAQVRDLQANVEEANLQIAALQENAANDTTQVAGLQSAEAVLGAGIAASLNDAADTTSTDTNQPLLADLQAQLLASEAENERLNNLLSELQVKQEELLDELEPTGPLSFEQFEVQPNYCDRRFDRNWVCVEGIDIRAVFNFNPRERMLVSLIDPQGDTIARKRVSGRTINRITFETPGNEPFLEGDYKVNIVIDSLFAKFDQTETFTLEKP